MKKLYLLLLCFFPFRINIFAQPLATEEFEYSIGDLPNG